jgi:hypothetical protein
MAKKDTSKTNVTARAALKAMEIKCRYCGNKPDVVRVLTPAGRAKMYRKCCAAAGIAA